jgi:hypothetical protein
MSKIALLHKTDDVDTFVGWFPEIDKLLFKHLKVMSLVLTIQSTPFDKPVKFTFKKKEY